MSVFIPPLRHVIRPAITPGIPAIHLAGQGEVTLCGRRPLHGERLIDTPDDTPNCVSCRAKAKLPRMS